MNNYALPQYSQQPNAYYAPEKSKSEVNAVKIELINPQAYGSAPQEPKLAPAPAPMMYQAPVYDYPAAPIYPSLAEQSAPVPFIPQQPLPAEKKTPERSTPPEPPVENFVASPAPKKDVPPALVEAQQEIPPAKAKEEKPKVDLKPIVGSLKSENLDEQFSAIQKVAEIGQDPKMPSDLLVNEEVFKGLTGVITKDTSKLPGPTAEQKQLREKKFSGAQLTPEQDSQAETLAPQEVAEMNKQYATYTLAVVQKNFRDSVDKEATKQGLEPVKLNEIPEINTVIDNVKSNSNPLVREASISALTYIAKPQDKETLGTIFSIASNDQDPIVQETAKKAQEKVNNLK
jgi:hypothetical protein